MNIAKQSQDGAHEADCQKKFWWQGAKSSPQNERWNNCLLFIFGIEFTAARRSAPAAGAVVEEGDKEPNEGEGHKDGEETKEEETKEPSPEKEENKEELPSSHNAKPKFGYGFLKSMMVCYLFE